MAEEHRRLAAIMFTDIVGFSALSQKDEDQALKVLETHRGILRPFFSQFDGVEIKTTGDGFLAEFASAIQAVKCAVEIQKAVYEHNSNSEPNGRFEIRIGIHVGDVVHSEGDVLGDGVNIASRIEPIAEPSGICISEQVYDHVRNKVEMHIARLGEKELKNIEVPLEIYRVFLPWEEVKSGTLAQPVKQRTSSRSRAPFWMAAVVGLVLIGAWIGYYVTTGDAEKELEEDRKSIAILPFADLSPDMGKGYFSDGITEELINALSKLKGVRVPARATAFSYKGTDKDIRAIGNELRVGTVLDGSVRTDGENFRITVSLNDVAKDEVIWSQKFDGRLENLFEIQDKITRKIVENLRVQFHLEDDRPLVVAASDNMGAYDCYWKGRAKWGGRTKEGFENALLCFESAIRQDPEFALAYAGLADTYHLLERYGHIPSNEGRLKVRENAEKALELDDSLAAAHTSLATIHEFEWNWEEANREFRRAIELDPSYVQARHWYSSFLAKIGRFEAAIDQIRTALYLDPNSPAVNNAYGSRLFEAHLDDEAKTQLEKTLELDPSFRGTRITLANLYANQLHFDKALQLIREEEKMFGASSRTRLARALVDKSRGMGDALDALVEGFGKGDNPEGGSLLLAMAYVAMGDHDVAFKQLEDAVNKRAFEVTHLQTIRVFDPLRSDPRYQELIEKIGFSAVGA